MDWPNILVLIVVGLCLVVVVMALVAVVFDSKDTEEELEIQRREGQSGGLPLAVQLMLWNTIILRP